MTLDRAIELLKVKYQLALIEQADEPDGQSILFLRYIEGRRFEDIADELHISVRNMWRLYSDAIEKLALNGSK